MAIRTSSFGVFARDFLMALLNIRREHFDVVFDLEFFPRFSTIVSYLSGAGTRIGYYLPKMWRGELLTHHIHFNPHRHVTEIFAAQLAPFDIEVTDFRLSAPAVNADKLAQLRQRLREYGVSEDARLLAVNVNASDLSTERRWPKDYFGELLNYITATYPQIMIVLIGAKDETGYVNTVYQSLSAQSQTQVLNLAGRLDIEELIALFTLSDLFITNDSGPLHIASSLGILTVAFFGPETPSLYGPPKETSTVFYARRYCSPCLSVYNAKQAMCNGDNRCMREITVSEVINTLEKKGLFL
jgi:ADP-heptose:LPS heptosyltransferase